MSDFDFWKPQAPSTGFSTRVATRALAERRHRRLRRVGTWSVSVAALAAGALAFAPRARKVEEHGEITAESRTEAMLGTRARVVLEPGAHVSWQGESATQDSGDVFYRVDKGPFTVKTPAGDVKVLGTAFVVKVRGTEMTKRDGVAMLVGGVMGAATLVGVYEGRVLASGARGGSVTVAAGEAAKLDERGATSLGDRESALRHEEAEADPLLVANQNLAESIKQYKDRLSRVEGEKQKLEKGLAEVEEKLRVAEADGMVPKRKSDFDLGPDDYAALAEEGTMKYRTPCIRPKGWTASPEWLSKAGLLPQDKETLEQAFRNSSARQWEKTVRPACIEQMGSAEIVDKLGHDTCVHLILNLEGQKNREAVEKAAEMVLQIRAGKRPPPGALEAQHPVFRIFYALTGELKAFESELAQSFGPEEAHRIAFSEELCVNQSTWGSVAGKKK